MLKILILLLAIFPVDHTTQVNRGKTIKVTKSSHPYVTTIRIMPGHPLAHRDTVVVLGNTSKRSTALQKSNLAVRDSVTGSENPDRNSATKTNQASSTFLILHP